jgi:stage V sporulation protein G
MISGLVITDTTIYKVKEVKEDNVVAYARITLNDEMIINGIKIVKGKGGPFIGFPQVFNKTEGRGYDICFPISVALREYIQKIVLGKYEEVLCLSN